MQLIKQGMWFLVGAGLRVDFCVSTVHLDLLGVVGSPKIGHDFCLHLVTLEIINCESVAQDNDPPPRSTLPRNTCRIILTIERLKWNPRYQVCNYDGGRGSPAVESAGILRPDCP